MSSGDGLPARRTTMEDRDNDASLELATSMTESTPPGESETLTFTPVETGEYAPPLLRPGTRRHRDVGPLRGLERR